MKEEKHSARIPKSKIQLLESQLNDLTEALKRERADSDNIRRRHEEQIGSLKTLVKANVVRELLPVIDNFERALKHVPSEKSNKQRAMSKEERKLYGWINGVKQIQTQFEATLGQMGVERIKTIDEVFDPKLHEAVAMEEGDGTVEIITEELQAGYKLGEEIIRHAMVKVRMEEAK